MPEQNGTSSSSSSSQSKRASRRAAKKQIQKQLKTKEQTFIQKQKQEQQQDGDTKQTEEEEKEATVKVEPEIEVEQLDPNNPLYAEMSAVFAAFAVNQSKDANIAIHVEEEDTSTSADGKTSHQTTEEKEAAAALKAAQKGMSKKKLKQMARLSIADLKQLVAKPEVVEVHDVNSADPKLLVSLKSYRNTVPVPQHWCQKRKYLQNKRGYEKPPWELPLFIADTGIAKIRGAQAEKEAAASAKAKGRQRMQPKMGKIDIDYQILHDAFFRYQTKPKLSFHGDMYYEGREFEQKLVDKRPGVYSQTLKAALNMKDDTSPPPWLQAMQRYGPPPSYPHLQIPGVNAPIPVGARWGQNDGEWGNPPLNEFGQPLWGGDLFGQVQQEEATKVDRTLWGQLEEESEGEESEEEEEEEEAGEEEVDDEGMRSVSSFASGLETPETIQLRKADGTGTETPNTVNAPRQLYTILEEKKAGVAASALFGSQHTYVLPTEGTTPEQQLAAKNDARRAKARGEVAVALNPEDLENLDAATLKRKYEATVEEQQRQAKAAAAGIGTGVGTEDEMDVQKRKKPKTDKSKDKSKKDELKGFKF